MVEPFESFAQNGEDVVLWRALGNLPAGRYVEIGANDPVVDSISWPFYQRGWRGVTVEPMATLATAHREQRPGDTQVEAVIGTSDTETVTFYEIPGTGLSTADAAIASDHRTEGFEVVEREVPVRRLDDVLAAALPADDDTIHFMMIDTEGFEAAVLATLDLRRYRPWVLVVESTAPNSSRPTHGEWEAGVVAAGYSLCLFDGLSRFYVADEHRATLAPALSYPACVLDRFTTVQQRELAARADDLSARLGVAEQQREAAERDLVWWRATAVTRWADAVRSGVASAGDQGATAELERMRATMSWRVTRPLRSVRTRVGALRR